MSWKVGVQTRGLIDDKNPDLGFALAKASGFECLDLNLDVFLTNTELYAGEANNFFRQSVEELVQHFTVYKECAEKHGLTFSQMHAPYPVWVLGRTEQNYFLRTEVIPKSFAIAKALDIPYMVIHPFKALYTLGREEERRMNVEFFREIAPVAREHGVVVCVENLYEGHGGRLVEGVCANPEEVIWYVDTLNGLAGEERFGVCLDTGHLQLCKYDARDCVKKIGKRLKILHLHENDGVGDLHQVPFTFGQTKEDGFDWDGLVCGLQEIGFDGTLSFETFPCLDSFPGAIKGDVLKLISEVGHYLAS